jgi:hypothetical protein
MRTKKTRNAPGGNKKRAVCESIGIASVRTGIPIDVLRAARAAGCPNFRGGRVYCDGLVEWISANGAAIQSAVEAEAPAGSLKEQKLSEEIRKLKLANDIKARVLVNVAKCVEAHAKEKAALIAILRQKLENEYPVAVAGLDPGSARVYGKRVVDAIIEAWIGLDHLWKF